ncbi:5189_t:CDS:2 [Ambispora leptoticha]|uniref:Methylmalonyl-CoA epimerase, mitochondrial n=1 Tax=Ambispora leptoticha TaxID=144679 RepID=A0A9N8ZN69_9GLOM|nr:5189_t:CDS:2 [Ambispora leptoticha]
MSFLRKFSSDFISGTRRISTCKFFSRNFTAATATGVNIMASSLSLSSSNIGKRNFTSTTKNNDDGLPKDHPVWKLGRLNHIAIAVPDLEKSSKFWREVMGAESVSEIKPQPDHGVYTVFVSLGNTKIELLGEYNDRSPIHNFLYKNKSGGIHHVCIEVDDVNVAVKDLVSKNVRSLDPEPKIGAHGKPVVFLHPKDCGGVLVELQQQN